MNGLVASYGLTEWWLSAFTPEEREVIDERFSPSLGGLGSHSLTRGHVQSYQPVTDFLNALAGWFRSEEDAAIATRIRSKIDELAHTNPLNEPGCYNGRHFTTYVADVEALKREGRLGEAENLLLRLVDATEAEDGVQKQGVALGYYEELAIIYRKRNEFANEVAILERLLARTGGDRDFKSMGRLQKAKALLEASNAGGPVLCPYCGVEIASPPRATGKCPACGEKVVMAKRPGEESRTPFTVEQAEGNKKALASARTRKKAIEHARGIGCTDSEFAAKEQELADKWGRPPSPNDVFWGLSNERLAKFPSFDKYSKWAELFRIYEHQTRVLVEEGRPHLDVAKKASEAFLHHLEDQCRFWGKEGVSIATRKDCCPECSRLGGQRLSIAEALETLPIPNEKCTNERCRCTWKADL